jgi:ketosteroid isomerase-like protein
MAGRRTDQPSANVELVRNGVAAWNRRDARLWLTYAAPEIEWVPAGPAAVEQAIYTGYDEVERGLTMVWDTWELFEFSESEVRDLDDSVLWLGHVKLRGGTSHIEFDQEFALYSQLGDGKFIRVHAFRSWREALDAARLDAQSMSEESSPPADQGS